MVWKTYSVHVFFFVGRDNWGLFSCVWTLEWGWCTFSKIDGNSFKSTNCGFNITAKQCFLLSLLKELYWVICLPFMLHCFHWWIKFCILLGFCIGVNLIIKFKNWVYSLLPSSHSHSQQWKWRSKCILVWYLPNVEFSAGSIFHTSHIPSMYFKVHVITRLKNACYKFVKCHKCEYLFFNCKCHHDLYCRFIGSMEYNMNIQYMKWMIDPNYFHFKVLNVVPS